MSRAVVCLGALALLGCTQPVVESRHAALGPGHVLFLDLDGAQVSSSASDDATTEHSQLASAAAYPPFQPSVPMPALAASVATSVLVDRVREYFLPFDVAIVTNRPTSGDWASVLVGGTPAALTPAQPSGIAGVSPVDCNDGNPRNLGFVFSDNFAPQFGGVVSLGAAIAHEAGHGYGLQHVSEPTDPMYSVPQSQQTLDDLFMLSFKSGSYSSYVAGSASLLAEQCGHPNPLDNHALLLAVLGPRQAALTAPPSITLAFPPTRDVLPVSFPVEVSASDDVGVTRVEIYRDLELVAVLDRAPYRAVLSLAPQAATTLTVEAIDADGQRARAERHFAVTADAPPYCEDATTCVGAQLCVDHFCGSPADLGNVPIDAGTDAAAPGSEDNGCAIAGHARSLSAPAMFALALLACHAALRPRRWRPCSWSTPRGSAFSARCRRS